MSTARGSSSSSSRSSSSLLSPSPTLHSSGRRREVMSGADQTSLATGSDSLASDLVTFTIGSRIRREVTLLIKETQHFRNGIRVLGVGDSLLNAGGWGRALTQKLNFQFEMATRFSSSSSHLPVEGLKTAATEVVEQVVEQRKILLFLDAYDVIVADPSEEKILKRFDGLRKQYPQCEVFFNAEFWCPLNCAGVGGAAAGGKKGYTVRSELANSSNFDRYPYLNSGVFIGYADTIRSILEDPEYVQLMAENTSDDQWWWSKVWILEREKRKTSRLCLDLDGALLQTTASTVIGGVIRGGERTSTTESSADGYGKKEVSSKFEEVATSAVQPLSARFPSDYKGKVDGYDLLLNGYSNVGDEDVEKNERNYVTRTDTGQHPVILHFNAGRRGYYQSYEVLRPLEENIMKDRLGFVEMDNAPSLIMLGGWGFMGVRVGLLVCWLVAPLAWLVVLLRLKKLVWKLWEKVGKVC